MNGEPADNRPQNLAWVTHRENCAHKIGHGTSRRGDAHPRVKCSSDRVQAFARALTTIAGRKGDIKALAVQMGVPLGIAYDIRRGKRGLL